MPILLAVSLLHVVIVLVLAGVILWAINTYIPMQPGIKKLLNIVVIIVLVLWLLKAFGVFDSIKNINV